MLKKFLILAAGADILANCLTVKSIAFAQHKSSGTLPEKSITNPTSNDPHKSEPDAGSDSDDSASDISSLENQSSKDANYQQVIPAHLVIDFSSLQPNMPKAWGTACQVLSNELMIGKGPWKQGIFRSFSCVQNGQTVSRDPVSKLGTWTLRLSQQGKRFTMILENPITNTLRASLSFPVVNNMQLMLADREFARAAAFALIDQLPVMMFVTKKDITVKGDKGAQLVIQYSDSKSRFRVPDPPEVLIFFKLAWNKKEQRWEPQVVGKALRRKHIKTKARYFINAETAAEIGKSPVWSANYDGPGARQDELIQLALSIREALSDEFDSEAGLAKNAKEILKQKLALASRTLLGSGGYLGLRYGKQLVRGEPLLEKVQVIGLLAEIRGGPLEGVRYYYDLVPKATVSEIGSDGNTTKLNLNYSRHLLGYAFSRETKSLVDLITLTPKVGIWSLKSRVPILRDDQHRVVASQQFNLQRALGVGAELGFEWLSGRYSLRPWFGIDSGFSLIKDGGSVSSRRAGLDGFFKVGSPFAWFSVPVKMALMVYSTSEQVVLSAPNAKGIEVKQLSVLSAYGGAGLALSW